MNVENGNRNSADPLPHPSTKPHPNKASWSLIFSLSIPLPKLQAVTSAGREMAQNQFKGGVRVTGSLVSPHARDTNPWGVATDAGLGHC